LPLAQVSESALHIPTNTAQNDQKTVLKNFICLD